MLGGMVALLALVCNASAQTVPYNATVMVTEAEVRCGASDKPEMYATNRLAKGETVQVVKELDGGWLAIKPPRGAFSWINARNLDKIAPATWMVHTTDDARVPVLYGTSLRSEKPTVESAKLANGAQVVALEAPRSTEDGNWLPIEPPSTEVRYIRASEVAHVPAPAGGSPPSNNSDAKFAVRPAESANCPPAEHAAPVSALKPPETENGGNPGWLAAQEAEKAGNLDLAIRLYDELGQRTANTDHDLAMQCHNKAYWLRQRSRGAVVAGYGGGTTAQNRIYPVPAAPVNHSVTCYVRQPACPPCPYEQHTTSGRLRLAGRSLDYKRTYALENNGLLMTYVTAQPGIDLESYKDRNVEVSGPGYYRGDVRANYLMASRVIPLP
jgi:hypothetical protein